MLVPPDRRGRQACADQTSGPTLVAVVDLGGTSVDVTLVRCTPEVFDLVGDPVSLTDVGGVDLDAAMVTLTEVAIGDVTRRSAPTTT